jgi:hypothetical protein
MGHTAGAMVASKHPDARAVAAKQQLIQQQMRTLQRLATLRQQRLMESMYRHEYFLESADLEQWIREQVQSAGSEDYGQDYEHLLVSVRVNTCSGEDWHGHTWSVQKISDYIFPSVSNSKRVGKLSVVVEGTFMNMHDFLLPHYTAR